MNARSLSGRGLGGVGTGGMMYSGDNNKARAGSEPANDGFANRCLSQLGDRARRDLEESFYRDTGKISISDGGCLTARLNRAWRKRGG